MVEEKIALTLPPELAAELSRVAAALGIGGIQEAARIAIEDWIARHREQADAPDPSGKYFVNEARDELIAKQRK
jgi:hypothetical protein